MNAAPAEGVVRMSNLNVHGLAGYPVLDRTGAHVGTVIAVDANPKGQARWIHVDLDQGGQARLASFRAWLDARQKVVSVQLDEDLILDRAPDAGVSSLST